MLIVGNGFVQTISLDAFSQLALLLEGGEVIYLVYFSIQ
jgi:hypothetical protein